MPRTETCQCYYCSLERAEKGIASMAKDRAAASSETLRYYALRGCRTCGVGADTLHEPGCPEVAKILAERLVTRQTLRGVDFASPDMGDAIAYTFLDFNPRPRNPEFPDLMAGIFATFIADQEEQRQADQWDRSYGNANHTSEERESAAAGQDFAQRTGDKGPIEPVVPNKAFDSLAQATTAAGRKAMPIATGVVDYFPDALAAVAAVSKIGNDQHNPGEPLHWAREKSTDEADALMRHFVERGGYDNDGVRHSAKAAWRALALLQKEIEADRA